MVRVLVIGGGASGMMAADAAASAGAETVILEKNKLCGLKLGITGKGRCNITNDCEVQELIKNTVRNGRFLYSAFSEFGPGDTMDYFESIGIPLKVERVNRGFPASDRAMDIVLGFRNRLRELRVKVLQGTAEELLVSGGRVTGVRTAEGRNIHADAVIIACGGMSYPRTGSTGDGYKLAKQVGHSIVPPTPSLTSLIAAGNISSRLEGLSLKNIAVTLGQGGKIIYKDFGEMVFTSNGVSGPVILSASSHIPDKNPFPCVLSIDLKPALDRETLDKRLLRDFEQNKNKYYINTLAELLPSKMIPVIAELSGIPEKLPVNSITREQREKLCGLLKNLTFIIKGVSGFNDAIVTRGGVSVKDISPKTMESKLTCGLYFAGEVMDVDAYTGGFNLQIAWSTGRKAGTCAAQQEDWQ